MKKFVNPLDSEGLHRSIGSPNHKPHGCKKVMLANGHKGDYYKLIMQTTEVEGNCEIVELNEIFNIFVQRE
jgi:hypothetical protein